MTTRVLLINFQEREAEKLRELGLEVDRGYYSDAIQRQEAKDPVSEEIYCYLPDAIDKYKVVIASLTHNTAVETEFRPKRKPYDKSYRVNFSKYWNDMGVLIVFYGDFKYKGLSTLGIFHIEFEDKQDKDADGELMLADSTGLSVALDRMKDNFVVPTDKALRIKESVSSGNGWEIRTVFKNEQEDALACYYNKPTPATGYNPRFIVLPQSKDNILVTSQLLKEMAKAHPGMLPELNERDWKSVDAYYPQRIREYDRQIAHLKQKLEQQINELTQKKQETTKIFETLKSILYLQGNDLKASIIEVLREFWALHVTELTVSEHKELHEDILIGYGKRKILARIYGTEDAQPSPKLITQVWQHLHYAELGKGVEGALIVNHDIHTDPKDRITAYKDEYDDQLEDIVFIDTYELFKLTVGIIDSQISVEDAKKTLFQKGRVQFDLGEPKKS
jgi:hypothetical protein